mmetsp:Transcript_71179/g.230393  ORF Transcript_71179/g.230393 Transcript_71179/m.230393 type:complete len:395 (+) Transcript_71179:19-1203(+)
MAAATASNPRVLWHVPALLLLADAAVGMSLSASHAMSHRGLPVAANGRLDLRAALRDRPPGAYSSLIRPLAQAMSLAYNASSGPKFVPSQAQATIDCPGCGAWERLHELTTDPQEAGVHSVAFANHEAKQAILSFRGACTDNRLSQCRADLCFLLKFQTYGAASKIYFGDQITDKCYLFSRKKLDYLGEARFRLQLLQTRVPGYTIVLTGHSLGGFLASVTAAQFPGQVQAVSFSPSPFQKALTEALHFSDAEIDALPADDMVALCDPYDCGLMTLEVPTARKGTMTCLYDEWDSTKVPHECYGMKQLVQDAALDSQEVLQSAHCALASHEPERYLALAAMTELQGRGRHAPGPRPFLPVCSKDYSVISDKLVASIRFAQQHKRGPWKVPELPS